MGLEPRRSADSRMTICGLQTTLTSDSLLANFNTAGTLFTLGAPFSKASFNGNIVRVGLNYHFYSWPPAPLVAKYQTCHQGISFQANSNPALAARFCWGGG
jgi:hypothetical protein